MKKCKCRLNLNKTNCTYWPEFHATCPRECPNSIVEKMAKIKEAEFDALKTAILDQAIVIDGKKELGAVISVIDVLVELNKKLKFKWET